MRREGFVIRVVLALIAFVVFAAITVSEQNPMFLIISIVVAVIFLRFGRRRGHRRCGGHGSGAYSGGEYDDDDDIDGGWFGGDSGWFGGDGDGDGGGNGGGRGLGGPERGPTVTPRRGWWSLT